MNNLPNKRIKDISGLKFGKLTVLGFNKVIKNAAHWLCECECGVTKSFGANSLTTGNTTSCGCSRVDGLYKHGMHHTSLYKIWVAMRKRCKNPASRGYKDYGGRGISVCERWEDFNNFYTDMGERPKGASIDRIDNDQGYSPENCEWVNPKENNRNRRSSVLTFDDVSIIKHYLKYKTFTQAEISRIFKVSQSMVSTINIGYAWDDVGPLPL